MWNSLLKFSLRHIVDNRHDERPRECITSIKLDRSRNEQQASCAKTDAGEEFRCITVSSTSQGLYYALNGQLLRRRR